MTEPLDTSTIRGAQEVGDYDTVIAEVRAAMAADSGAALADPVIRDWMERRYRNLFLQEAAADPTAVKHSQAPFPLRLIDNRSQRERVAKRMLKRFDDAELAEELPPATLGSLTNTTLVFAPGLLTGLLPVLAFQQVWPRITNRFGLRVIASDSHPMRSTEANVADLENAIERGIGVAPDHDGTYITADDNPAPPGDVLLIGYSKGSPDIMSLLVARPDLAPRIKGFIGWAGAMGGSYAADDIFEKIKDVKEFDVVSDMRGRIGRLMLRLAPVIQVQRVNRRLDEYDIKGALRSLTTWQREEFMEQHRGELNELGIPMFYFSGATTIFDVPWFQRQGTWDLKKYDPDNDMQLTQEQTRPPSASAPHLATFNANHWDLSYDTFPWYATLGSTHLKDPFAREPAMAAIILFMSELGILD